ncbi:hypothetical protein ACHAXA_009374 [Cyclostephanos tholiformis]|uniref:tRNA-uridine aminocarboxypropyltransferase n=1 Tax=Cyclostephanos tholiformis TaxID=382380 RepID=A0ABD3RU42_9STRA
MSHDDNDSLSHMLSSPERYAKQLGMTVEEIRRYQEDHAAASRMLNRRVKASLDDGPKKHSLICEHRFRYAKHPFVCRKCWCYLPICLCQEAASLSRIKLPLAVKQVILWTHHREWTSISNSGSLLPLLLDDTKLLMKGLPQHDEELQSILGNIGSGHFVVLWPDNDTSIKQGEETYPVGPKIQHDRVTWQDLQTTLAGDDNDCQVTLIVLEGTWRTARRMASKLPATIQRLSLPPDVLFWSPRPSVGNVDDVDYDETKRIQPSLLRPLRRQEGGSELNLCTAEAVTAALVGLGLSEENGGRILDLVKMKVDQTRRYRGKQVLT